MISSTSGALSTAAAAMPNPAANTSLTNDATSTETPAPQRNAFQRIANGSGSR